MEQDLAYFARRAEQERSAAIASVDQRARKAHMEMARRYDAAIQELQSRPGQKNAIEREVAQAG